MKKEEVTWIGQILADRRLTSDTTYAEKRVLMIKLLEQMESSGSNPQKVADVEKAITTLRHLLILAIDRLDYETLHLVWLPQLAKLAELIGKPSIDVQLLSHLFSLFLGIDETEGLVGSEYSREAGFVRLTAIRNQKFMAPPTSESNDADYFKVVESLVCLTWCHNDGYDTFFDSKAFTLAV